jgi:hypothetical protein
VTRTKMLIATAATSFGLLFAGTAAAEAQPRQEGLVNVNIEDVQVFDDVGIGVAANILANVCGVQVNAAVIAEQVVRNNEPLVRECSNVAGDPDVIITQ